MISRDRIHIEDAEAWHWWADQMPPLQFPAHWRLTIMPPYGGTLLRFNIASGDRLVSVTLAVSRDFEGGAFWEVDTIIGDAYRCALLDTAKLMATLTKALDHDNG